MSAQLIRKAKRPRVVTTLETKLKIIADFEAENKRSLEMWKLMLQENSH
jgi:hypothetical protein